ncbi:transcription factor activity protein [Scheffersomyces coipomensis]|uniref:transcription factor activity protein n=1 Tax=Scheffersomyces coipomensis TaxID=1788519 RepID=UPI00315D3614
MIPSTDLSPISSSESTPNNSSQPLSSSGIPVPHHSSSSLSSSSSMTSNKKKSTRRSVACKSCHSLKVKCTPADPQNPGGTCIRCQNANRKCEIDLNQTRKRRKASDLLSSTLSKENITINSNDETSNISTITNTKVNSPTFNNDNNNASLRKQIKLLEAQVKSQQQELQHHHHHHQPQPIRHNTSSDSISDAGSPPFISKIDLEREINVLCDNASVSKLTDLTDNLKIINGKRTQLLNDNRVIDVLTLGILTLEEAEERLQIYRSKIYDIHQLIEIPQHVTAHELSKHQPFLFNAIMSITNTVYQKEIPLDKALKIDNAAFQTISTEVMVAGTKSDELVKALLLLCIWYNSPELFRQRRYHLLISIGVTMLHDLGIVAKPYNSFKTSEAGVSVTDNSNNKKSTPHYQSLVLITYFTAVSICLILKRTIYVKWTPYVEECCSSLENQPEARWTELALFARLTHTLDKIHHVVHAPEIAERKISTSQYIIHEFQKNLSLIRSNIKPEDHATMAFYYSVEAYLHEPCLSNIFVADAEPDNTKLTETSAKSISNCTNSCLNALDEFNHLTPEQVASIPLFYGSRIIYTAGMLLRLRYLILSLPSHIEKDLVPYHAINAIQKANRLLDETSKLHTVNHFLKKTRLVLQLFIQTYATQVQELIKKNGETPQNFKPIVMPKKVLNTLDKLTAFYRAHHGNAPNTLINDDIVNSNPPIDVFGYGSTFRRDNKTSNIRKSQADNSTDRRASSVGGSPRSDKSTNIPIIPRNQAGVQSFPSMYNQIDNNGNNNNLMAPPFQTNNVNQMSYRQPSLSGAFPNVANLANADQLENSFLALNEEFWVDLLSSESDRIYFSNNNHNNGQSNDEVFFMS